ncbi:MAG: hypothetical protein DRJ05_00290 [Bacteroidetes bacterium]|nr:MAG: hypothetical protein DRJ05_00290 [Bacteroidota bacterium]
MDKKSELATVLQKIDELRAMVETHIENPGAIHPLETGLVKEKLYFMYDVYFKIANQAIPVQENKLEDIIQENIEEREEETIEPQPEITIEDLGEVARNPVIAPSAEDTVILSVENSPDLFPDQHEEIGIKEQKVVEPEESEEVNFEKAVEPKFMENEIKPEIKTPVEENMDLFSTAFDSEAKTVAEEISEKVNEESVADKLQKNKITELKEAIGINEKFFFMNELFDGVMKEYNDAIEALNSISLKEEAFNYLSQLKDDRDWNEGTEAYGQLKGILERKFD